MGAVGDSGKWWEQRCIFQWTWASGLSSSSSKWSLSSYHYRHCYHHHNNIIIAIFGIFVISSQQSSMLTLLIISWAIIKISEHEGTIKVRDFNRGGEWGVLGAQGSLCRSFYLTPSTEGNKRKFCTSVWPSSLFPFPNIFLLFLHHDHFCLDYKNVL